MHSMATGASVLQAFRAPCLQSGQRQGSSLSWSRSTWQVSWWLWGKGMFTACMSGRWTLTWGLGKSNLLLISLHHTVNSPFALLSRALLMLTAWAFPRR